MSEKNRETHTKDATTVAGQQISVASAELSNKLMCILRETRQQPMATVPMVEDVLRNQGLHPAALDANILTDLVYTEWMLRLEQGESPSREEYLRRFPLIRSQLERQWMLDESLVSIAQQTIIEGAAFGDTESSEGNSFSTPQPVRLDSIGKYRIISLLGSGGQADVYRASHPGLGRDVVIKVIRPRWHSGLNSESVPPESAMTASLTEGRLLAQLSHPNIAQIFDVDLQNGCPFLVMEYVQGLSLDQYCQAKRMDGLQTAILLRKIALAVAAAHERGILHRDIKPQNIVVDADGSPKLIDFGLARMADVWQTCDEHPGICGTLGFLSPEQAAGDATRIGPTSDVFALGAVLFFMLTGEPLYQGSSTITGVSIEGLLERAKQCDWDRSMLRSPQISRGLAVVCERALQPDPSSRFASAREFADALTNFAKPSRIPAFVKVTAAATLFAALALFVWQNSKTETKPKVIPLDVNAVANNSHLKPIIHLEDARIELLDAVPLKSGTLLHLEAEIPAGVSFILLSINGTGRMQQVDSFPAKTENWHWRYPEEPTEVLPLTGPAGTECLMLLGTADIETMKRDSVANNFSTAWQEGSEWPQIASDTLLRLRGKQVTVEQTARDFGAPQRTEPNPAERVTMSLEKFAVRFESTYPLIEGIAFRHIR